MFPCSSEREAFLCDGPLHPSVFAPWLAVGREEPGPVQGYGSSVQSSLGAHSKTSADTETPDSWEQAGVSLQETIILGNLKKMSRCGA